MSLWSWTISRARRAAAIPVGREWADRAIAHARAHGDVPALCVALASLADFLAPGSPEAARVFDELHALDDPSIAPLARSGAPIAEASHRRKLGDFPAAIACVQRALALISETGVRNGIWIVQSWLIGFNLAAGRTAEVLADGLPLLEQLQGTRNERRWASAAARSLRRSWRTTTWPAPARWRRWAGVRMPRAFRCSPMRPGRISWLCWPRSKAGRGRLPSCWAGAMRGGRAPAANAAPPPVTAIQRAESIAADALGDETFAHLRREGAHLGSDDVDAIAFAAEDIS